MIPSYAATHAYDVLADLCGRAGLALQYVDLPASIFARSKGRVIQMPTDERFSSSDHAGIVLGHELAHFFVNRQFPEIEAGTPMRLERRMLLESECDRLGTYFFTLAMEIANREDASIGGIIN